MIPAPVRGTGADGTAPKILKETVVQISVPLRRVFNMSLHEGEVHLANNIRVFLMFKKQVCKVSAVICKLLGAIIRDRDGGLSHQT